MKLILIALLALTSCASELHRIDNEVNRSIEYKYDTVDEWQPASETDTLKTGDCEDFAILKYQKMIDMGIDQNSIYFLIVKLKGSKSNHAMLRVGDKYYDSFMQSRGIKNSDFEVIEEFTNEKITVSNASYSYYPKFLNAIKQE